MEKKRILELLARKMGQTATLQELEELEKLLKEFPEYHFLKDTNEAMRMDFYPAGMQEEKALVQKNWQLLAEAMSQAKDLEARKPVKVRLIAFLRPARVAALVTGAALIGAALYFSSRRQQSAAASGGQLIAKNGEKVRQLLPDSTFIRLNAGSRLTYAAGYGKTNREVYLQGEAFFDVAPDKDRPFLVHAGKLIIKVLGTSFNVRSYAKDSAVETTLIKGKVEVQLNGGEGRHILLLPNEKLVVSGGKPAPEKQPLIHLNDTTAYNEVAWIDNKLVFWNEPFDKVAEKMERWYDVRIHFDTPALTREVLSGTFEKETLDQALNILRMTTDFTFYRNGKDIYLK